MMVYLVEDDDNIRELVVYTLTTTGLDAKGFSKPSDFWAAVREELPSLVLLDIMLPEEDGLTVLSKLKADKATGAVPVIMLTAKGSEIDKVRGFDCGADDYISKPFGVMELVARVRARLRKNPKAQPDTNASFTLGSLYVCPATHTVQVNGEDCTLTLKEFEILRCLLENQNVVMTRDRLLNQIWGYAFDGENRTVDVHIRTLRQKLGEAGGLIQTVRGIGYKITD